MFFLNQCQVQENVAKLFQLNEESIAMALNETALEDEAEKCCKRLIVQGAKGASGKYIRSKTVVNGRYVCITILKYRYY